MLVSLLKEGGLEKLNGLLKEVSEIQNLENEIEQQIKKTNALVYDPYYETALYLIDKVLVTLGIEVTVIDAHLPVSGAIQKKIKNWKFFIDDFAAQIKKQASRLDWAKERIINENNTEYYFKYCLPSWREHPVKNHPKLISNEVKVAKKDSKRKRSSTAKITESLSQEAHLRHKQMARTISPLPIVTSVVRLPLSKSTDESTFFVVTHELFLRPEVLKNRIMQILSAGRKSRGEIAKEIIQQVCVEENIDDFSLRRKEELSDEMQKSMKVFKSRISYALGQMKKAEVIRELQDVGGNSRSVYEKTQDKTWEFPCSTYFEKSFVEIAKTSLNDMPVSRIENFIASLKGRDTNNYRYLITDIKNKALAIVEEKIKSIKSDQRVEGNEYVPYTEVVKEFVVKVAKIYFASHKIFNEAGESFGQNEQVISNDNNQNQNNLEVNGVEASYVPEMASQVQEEPELVLSEFSNNSPLMLETEKMLQASLMELEEEEALLDSLQSAINTLGELYTPPSFY